MFLELLEEFFEKFELTAISGVIETLFGKSFEHTHTLVLVKGAHLALSIDNWMSSFGV